MLIFTGGLVSAAHCFLTPCNMYATIKSQTLAMIAEITAEPKPTYSIDGQSVLWTDYLKQLRTTVEWCDQQIARSEAGVEEVTVCR